MPDRDPPFPSVPDSRAVPKKHTRLSLVWIIPIVAAVVGAWVAVTRILAEGPKITIVFQSAEGLEAGKTKINYRGVDIGTITAIRLSEDHQRVISHGADGAPDRGLPASKTRRFWVVRPRISGANVTGLGTLISGAYIGMEIGSSKEPKRDFVALETPPVVTGDAPGRFFVLKTSDLGSLDTRHAAVLPAAAGRSGRVVQAGQGRQVLHPQGIRESALRSVRHREYAFLAGERDRCVALRQRPQRADPVAAVHPDRRHRVRDARDRCGPASRPTANTVFTLFGDRAEAFEPAARSPQTYRLIFKESVRGLAPGAPVEFRGIPVGEVADVRAQIDLKTFEFSVPVTIRLDPQRLGVKVIDTASGADLERMRRKLIDAMVAHGVRAQLRTGNLLTGAVFVAFDFFPGAPPATVDWSQTPVQLPTIPGQLAGDRGERRRTSSRSSTRCRFKQIGDELRKTIDDLDRDAAHANRHALDRERDAGERAGTIDNANNFLEPNSVRASNSAARSRRSAVRRARCACSPTTLSAIPRRSCAARGGRQSDGTPYRASDGAELCLFEKGISEIRGNFL